MNSAILHAYGVTVCGLEKRATASSILNALKTVKPFTSSYRKIPGRPNPFQIDTNTLQRYEKAFADLGSVFPKKVREEYFSTPFTSSMLKDEGAIALLADAKKNIARNMSFLKGDYKIIGGKPYTEVPKDTPGLMTLYRRLLMESPGRTAAEFGKHRTIGSFLPPGRKSPEFSLNLFDGKTRIPKLNIHTADLSKFKNTPVTELSREFPNVTPTSAAAWLRSL